MTSQPGRTETRTPAGTETRTQSHTGAGTQPGTQAHPQALTVHADRDRCCGSGLCMLRLPEIFDQDDDGIVVLLNPAPPERLRAEVAKAVDACPSGALTLDHT